MTNNIISNYQFGFLPGRSTQLAVFELVKHIYSSLNKKKIFGSICLDISKAFDCINHDKLFDKLISGGVSQRALKWFRSYFTRTQAVRFNNAISRTLDVNTGIGQGTILGPLIFVFYINDVIRKMTDLRVNMYADDCLIYSVGNNWSMLRPKLQQGLNDFYEWSYDNCMKLNIGKSKALMIGSNHKLSGINFENKFTLNGEVVHYVNDYNYLGLLLDKNMTLSPLLARVKRIVSNKIYCLVKIRNQINTQCAIAIYKQTILPLLDYSGFLLISCNISERGDLQTLQNHALRICYNVRLRDKVSVNLMHNRAKLLSLEQRRQKQVLCLMFILKQRHDVARVYARGTRAANVYTFTRERYNCIKYKNSPYYKGALLWDSLPAVARNSGNLKEFKGHLRTAYRHYDSKLS